MAGANGGWERLGGANRLCWGEEELTSTLAECEIKRIETSSPAENGRPEPVVADEPLHWNGYVLAAIGYQCDWQVDNTTFEPAEARRHLQRPSPCFAGNAETDRNRRR